MTLAAECAPSPRRRALIDAMRFLITNDDGILAHGLECLVRGGASRSAR